MLYLMEPTRSITFAVSATLRVSKYLSLPFSITISIREFPTLFASIHALFMRVISLIVSNYSSFFFISVIRIPAFLTSSCLHYFVIPYRTVTIGSGPFSEDDLDSLPRLYKFHKQLSLLDSLQGKQWGGLEKLQRLKQAELEGFLPKTYASNNIRSNSVTDDKLLKDWNFDMNA